MKQYEYLVLSLTIVNEELHRIIKVTEEPCPGGEHTHKNVETQNLDTVGRDGWRLISVDWDTGAGVFVRELDSVDKITDWIKAGIANEEQSS